MTDVHSTSGVLMTGVEVRSRVAGLLTVCASAADGSMAGSGDFDQARLLIDDLRSLRFQLVDIEPKHRDAVQAAVMVSLGVYEMRLINVIDAFMQAFTELARAHAEVTGGGEAAADVVQQLALYWATQTPAPTD